MKQATGSSALFYILTVTPSIRPHDGLLLNIRHFSASDYFWLGLDLDTYLLAAGRNRTAVKRLDYCFYSYRYNRLLAEATDKEDDGFAGVTLCLFPGGNCVSLMLQCRSGSCRSYMLFSLEGDSVCEVHSQTTSRQKSFKQCILCLFFSAKEEDSTHLKDRRITAAYCSIIPWIAALMVSALAQD
jgi:hypothetical protein